MLWIYHIWFLLYSLYAYFLEAFLKKNHKWVFNFIKGIICSFWNNCVVFIFQFVNMVSHIVWFVNIEESLHPWDKAHLVMMYDLFNMLLDYFLEICWVFLHISSSDILAFVFFFVAPLSHFGIRVIVASLNGSGIFFPFLCNFLEEFE